MRASPLSVALLVMAVLVLIPTAVYDGFSPESVPAPDVVEGPPDPGASATSAIAPSASRLARPGVVRQVRTHATKAALERALESPRRPERRRGLHPAWMKGLGDAGVWRSHSPTVEVAGTRHTPFTLRKHGMQYMVKGDFPDDVFPVTYSIKDIGYALQLAEKHGVDAAGARLADKRLREAEAAGYGKLYCPVMYKLLDT